MFAFLLKRSFWNYIDNLAPSFLINILFFAISAGAGFALYYMPALLWLQAIVLACYILLIGQILLLSAYLAHRARIKKPFGISQVVQWLKNGSVRGIPLSFIIMVMCLLGYISLPFYINMGGVPGAAGAALVSWVLILLGSSFLYFLPQRVVAKERFVVSLSKSLVFLFGHPLLTLVAILASLFQLVLSLLFLFIIPGITSISALSETLLFLVEKEREWMENNRGASRKEVPWHDLLEEESRDLNRSFIETFFPFRRK